MYTRFNLTNIPRPTGHPSRSNLHLHSTPRRATRSKNKWQAASEEELRKAAVLPKTRPHRWGSCSIMTKGCEWTYDEPNGSMAKLRCHPKTQVTAVKWNIQRFEVLGGTCKNKVCLLGFLKLMDVHTAFQNAWAHMPESRRQEYSHRIFSLSLLSTILPFIQNVYVVDVLTICVKEDIVLPKLDGAAHHGCRHWRYQMCGRHQQLN